MLGYVSCLRAGEEMSGIIIKLGKGARIKDGRIKLTPVYRDASHAIRARKSKRVRVVKGKVT